MQLHVGIKIIMPIPITVEESQARVTLAKSKLQNHIFVSG